MVFVVVSFALLAFLAVRLVKLIRFDSSKKPLIVPKGDNAVKVYTYNGLPLKRYKRGEEFFVELIGTTTTMKSVYTGTSWTGRHGVKANGLQFGFAEDGSIALNYIYELSDRYKSVQVHASVVWDLGMYPIVELQLPGLSWFKEALDQS